MLRVLAQATAVPSTRPVSEDAAVATTTASKPCCPGAPSMRRPPQRPQEEGGTGPRMLLTIKKVLAEPLSWHWVTLARFNASPRDSWRLSRLPPLAVEVLRCFLLL